MYIDICTFSYMYTFIYYIYIYIYIHFDLCIYFKLPYFFIKTNVINKPLYTCLYLSRNVDGYRL